MDLVNEYFRRFYPPDHAIAWETRGIGHIVGRQYIHRHLYDNFPPMVCADGFSMSVQGHWGAYSSPRDDYAVDGYSAVEVWCLSSPEPLFDPYGDGESPYGYVPVSVVDDVIRRHGGLAP